MRRPFARTPISVGSDWQPMTSSVSTTVTGTKPAGLRNGSLLVCIVGSSGNTTFSAPSNTVPWVAGGQAGGFSVWYKRIFDASLEPSSYTFTQPSGLLNNRGFLVRIEGTATNPVVDVQRAVASTAPSAPTATEDATSEWMLSMIQMLSGGTGQTIPAGMTLGFVDTTAGAVRGVAYEQLIGASGSTTPARTWGVSGNHGIATIIVRAAT